MTKENNNKDGACLVNLLFTLNINFSVKNLPVTRIVDHLMELKPSPETDDFRYFDPKLLKPTELGSNSAPRNRAPYQDAIVFMVGGGNYSEYQNLVDYAKVTTILLFLVEIINNDLYLDLFAVENGRRKR